MSEKDFYNRIECVLFVAGDPVSIAELARTFGMSKKEMAALLHSMEEAYAREERGIQLLVTEDTAQLISNRTFVTDVECLLQPEETKSVSQSLLETLAVVAYRQPVTRADIEAVRGVRCEYAVSQLQKLGLIVSVGKKDVVGHPTLFGTTDAFLRKFGIHRVEEMPEFLRFSNPIAEQSEETEEITV